MRYVSITSSTCRGDGMSVCVSLRKHERERAREREREREREGVLVGWRGGVPCLQPAMPTTPCLPRLQPLVVQPLPLSFTTLNTLYWYKHVCRKRGRVQGRDLHVLVGRRGRARLLADRQVAGCHVLVGGDQLVQGLERPVQPHLHRMSPMFASLYSHTCCRLSFS